MTARFKPESKTRRRPSAIRSGIYSIIAVLPGEDHTAYIKLHRDIVDELEPVGALEKEQVEAIARLTWRKKNFATLHIAMLARSRMETASELQTNLGSDALAFGFTPIPAEEVAAAQESVRKEFEGIYDFDAIGPEVSLDTLARELDIEERIDGLIDRCMKRMLFLRGLKSMSAAAPVRASRSIAGPSYSE